MNSLDSREKFRILSIQERLGRKLAKENPEIAELYRKITKLSLNSQRYSPEIYNSFIWNQKRIGEKYLPEIKNESISIGIVHAALDILIDREEKNKLGNLHIKTNGIYFSRVNGPPSSRHAELSPSEISRRGGIEIAKRKGYQILSDEKKQAIYKLSLRPEYQRGQKVDNKKLARVFDITSNQIKGVLYKTRKRVQQNL